MKKTKKKGPKPDRVKINQDWEEAVGEAIKKEKPKEGWPEKENKDSKDEI